MEKINIVLGYPESETQWYAWATGEAEIDFDRQRFEATRCTAAFATMELKSALNGILEGKEVSICSTPADGVNIVLLCEGKDDEDESYALQPTNTGLEISAPSRVGLLYGAYEFLKLQGYRWYAPDSSGTYVPPKTDRLVFPAERMKFAPDMDIARGFDFEGYKIPHTGAYLWMARNRLNSARNQPGTNESWVGSGMVTHEAYQRKLGIRFKCGGHYFHALVSPGRILEGGKTFWDLHKDWYGIPSKGEVTKQNCWRTQFCFTNPGMVKFMCDETIRMLKTEYSMAERLDVWGLDTWGEVCQCPECKKIPGNNTDKTLHFVSKMRDAINNSDLDHKVRLVICSYGGTCTLEAPVEPIPQNLIDAGDMIVTYPITRCYRHTFNDSSCHENSILYGHLKDWLACSPALPVTMGEYYNCSKFIEMPTVFPHIMAKDIKHYVEIGVRGITYMHVPLGNYAMRALNHHLYAELSWDASKDEEALLTDFFAKRFGKDADQMREAYALLEEALCDVQQWRSWSPESILSQLQQWNGGRPKAEIRPDYHYDDEADIIAKGEHYIKLLHKALDIVLTVKKQYFDNVPHADEIPLAKNPSEIGKILVGCNEEHRLGEDERYIRYGIDIMELMTAVLKYHYALYKGGNGDAEWVTVVALYDRMDTYYAAMCSVNCGPNGQDALSRSQLRSTIRRCASERKYGI